VGGKTGVGSDVARTMKKMRAETWTRRRALGGQGGTSPFVWTVGVPSRPHEKTEKNTKTPQTDRVFGKAIKTNKDRGGEWGGTPTGFKNGGGGGGFVHKVPTGPQDVRRGFRKIGRQGFDRGALQSSGGEKTQPVSRGGPSPWGPVGWHPRTWAVGQKPEGNRAQRIRPCVW